MHLEYSSILLIYLISEQYYITTNTQADPPAVSALALNAKATAEALVQYGRYFRNAKASTTSRSLKVICISRKTLV